MSDNNNDLNRGAEIILRFAAQELPDVIPELGPIQARILKTHLEEAANSFASGELTIREKTAANSTDRKSGNEPNRPPRTQPPLGANHG